MSSTPNGRTVLVTGASRGIGRETARRLAADGYAVVAHYGRSADAAEALREEVLKVGGRLVTLAADLEDADAARRLAALAVEALAGAGWGDRLHALVNNAGIASFVPFADTDAETLDRLHAVNVRAPFLVTKGALADGALEAGGRIVNLTSLVTRTYFAGLPAYAMSKGAVDVMTRHLAADLGPRGITVNAVSPGAIDTEMSGWLRTDEGHALALDIQALKRIGQATDIAAVVAFLLSPDAGWITGQTIEASGGTKL